MSFFLPSVASIPGGSRAPSLPVSVSTPPWDYRPSSFSLPAVNTNLHDSKNRADFNNPTNPQIVAHFVINTTERDALAQYFILFARRDPRLSKFPDVTPTNPRAWIKLDLYTLPVLNLHLKSADGRKKYGRERFPTSIINEWNYMGVQCHNLTDNSEEITHTGAAVLYFGGFCLMKDMWIACGQSPPKGSHLWLLLVRREYSPMKKNWLICDDQEKRPRKAPRVTEPDAPDTQFFWQYVPWFTVTRTPPSPVLYSGVHETTVTYTKPDGTIGERNCRQKWMGQAVYIGTVINHYQDQYGTPMENQTNLAGKALQPEIVNKDYKRWGSCLNLLQVALGVHG